MKNYPRPDVKRFGDLLTEYLMDASIQQSMGGLGGCKEFNIENFPAEFRPYIIAYLAGNNDSVAITYAAMKTKEQEPQPC